MVKKTVNDSKRPSGFWISAYWKAGLALILGIGWICFLFFGRALWPLRSSGEKVLYEIPKDATLSFLARDLHDKRLIAFPNAFKLFVRLAGQEKHLPAGFYYLPPRNSVVEMAFQLRSGNMATHTVTIPEGKASWEIYGILSDYFPLDSTKFDSLVRDASFAHALGIKATGIEGYLFPDTYILPWRISERDVLRTMVGRFKQIATELPVDSDVIKGFKVHGWVTLASIVEKEAAVNNEKGTIAGVFFNRLKKGWTLGADPTTRFALRKLTGPLSSQDLKVKSGYNTRLFRGLPPGPICNPGRDALTAALLPTATKMMFFVAKNDGSREHYFSVSLLEHNAFKKLASDNRLRRFKGPDTLSQAP